MKQQDLTRDSVSKLFMRYLLPSISATLVTSIYILADTIIVGKGIGEVAVAGLNIVLPLFSFFFGTGLLFGVGGSVLFSISKGQGDEERANRFFTIAAMSAIATIVLYFILCNVFLDPLLSFLGATEQTLPYIREYIPYLIWGVPIYVGSGFLQTFIRNDKNPNLSMIGVITGGVLNIVLDIVFVFFFGWGMAGASIASMIGVFVTCLILLSHFFRKKNTLKFVFHGLELKMLGNILLTGFSSFLIEVAGGIVILSFNVQLLKYTGVMGITAYSIISNTALIVTSLCNGIAQASLPILATNFGANKMDRVKKAMHLSLCTSILLGLCFFLFSMIFPQILVYTFINPDEQLLAMSIRAVRLYSFAFFAMAINYSLNNYFQAILRPFNSLCISLLRGLILNLLLVYLLPIFLGVTGIWVAIPIVESITVLVGITMLSKTKLQLQE